MKEGTKKFIMGLALGLVAAGVFIPFGEDQESLKDKVLKKD